MGLVEKNLSKAKLKRSDRVLIVGALVTLLIFLSIFLSEDLFNFIFRLGHTHSTKPVIGEISHLKNDIRHRDSTSLAWESAMHHELVRNGDGVFTGSSSNAKVTLERGGHIDLDANTLIIFTEQNGDAITELERGNFVIQLKGKAKIGLRGEIVELQGDGSKVQVYLDQEARPRLRLLSGNASVKTSKRRFSLQPGKLASITQPDAYPKPITPPPPPRVLPERQSGAYVYFDKLSDLYQLESGEVWRERELRSPFVDMQVLLAWKREGDPKRIYGQHSATEQFKQPIAFESIGASHALRRVFVGENFWRISADGQHWEMALFSVKTALVDLPPPTLELRAETLPLLSSELMASFPIRSAALYRSYLVETSLRPEFTRGHSQIRLLTSARLHAVFHQPGEYYFRIRGVTEKGELSRFSEVARQQVVRPALPAIPRLAQNDLVGFVNEPIGNRWSASRGAKHYLLEIFDAHGVPVHKKELKTPSFQFKSAKAGRFKYKVTAVNQYQQQSRTAASGSIEVASRVVPPRPPPERVPAQATSAIKRTEAEDRSQYRNLLFSNSTLDLEGAGFAMYSAEQLRHPEIGSPLALLLGLRTHYWSGANGAELSLKAKAANVNAAGALNSPLALEARYLHRWSVGFNPFFSFREMRIAVLVGLEDYHNTGGAYFSSGYDLLKTGLSLNFPALYSWDTGGEIIYGFNWKGDKKYEISGHLHYYVKRDWSLGVGYRLHLFEAGSTDSAPVNLPYREGYGEAYSVLRLHY